jgi:hypothetical protein
VQTIVNFINWLNDMDWGWWPLLKCRPPKDKRISNRVVLRITPFFGTVSGVLIFLVSGEALTLLNLLLSLVAGWVLFFLIFRFTGAVAWNVRAKKLNSSAESTN